MFVPRHESTKACTHATFWNFNCLIFYLVFWFSVPTNFYHKGTSACTWAWAQEWAMAWAQAWVLLAGCKGLHPKFLHPQHLWVREVFLITAGKVWVSPPPKLHAIKSKIIIHRLWFMGQKPSSNHQGDSNEPPINVPLIHFTKITILGFASTYIHSNKIE